MTEEAARTFIGILIVLAFAAIGLCMIFEHGKNGGRHYDR